MSTDDNRCDLEKVLEEKKSLCEDVNYDFVGNGDNSSGVLKLSYHADKIDLGTLNLIRKMSDGNSARFFFGDGTCINFKNGNELCMDKMISFRDVEVNKKSITVICTDEFDKQVDSFLNVVSDIKQKISVSI